jgi:PIN domain nuclease of toxin-antitoxin system
VRLLLDTHVFLWWLSDDARLGSAAKELIAEQDNRIMVSVGVGLGGCGKTSRWQT